MQTKKLSVQNAIIDAAAEEFFKYGFRGASMRRMAKNAGTGIGNFYNYFKGKNEIFAYIVSEQYAKTQIIISRIRKTGDRFQQYTRYPFILSGISTLADAGGTFIQQKNVSFARKERRDPLSIRER